MNWPIPDHQIEITTFRSGGPGGQHKNVTESAVRVKHLPTGIVVVATASRSQHRNKEAALEELACRLAARARKRKPRVVTKPSAASRKRRIESKVRRAKTKAFRKAPADE
jgi:protein subunit release factor A